MTTRPRIYADFNGLVAGVRDSTRTAVVLDTFGSLRDLANAGIVLKEGYELVVWDASDGDEDLEGHGTAQFDSEMDWWVVEFDVQGVRHLPRKDRTTDESFRCVSCRYELAGRIRNLGLNLGDVCPDCGTPIHSPLAPPAPRG